MTYVTAQCRRTANYAMITLICDKCNYCDNIGGNICESTCNVFSRKQACLPIQWFSMWKQFEWFGLWLCVCVCLRFLCRIRIRWRRFFAISFHIPIVLNTFRRRIVQLSTSNVDVSRVHSSKKAVIDLLEDEKTKSSSCRRAVVFPWNQLVGRESGAFAVFQFVDRKKTRTSK